MIDPTINKEFQKEFNFVSIDDSILPIGGTYELSTNRGESSITPVHNPDPIRFVPETPIRRWIRNIDPDFLFRIGRSVFFGSGILAVVSGIVYVFYSIGKFVLDLVALIEWRYVFAGIAFVLIVLLMFRVIKYRYNLRFGINYTPDQTTEPNWVGYGHISRRKTESGGKQQINIVLVNGDGKVTDFQKQ